ncbi:cell envelope integrity protein TolA [Thaumasiovibrio subtropicus]|uniref:cell envelope integrity protein TolA n=1 Tax=Thaumasiovibrio subtropicus TaxID=1891207 RepID=UPI000B35BBB7|nr:cell envelope integrity protein TolA [Thaumasiovibrio subtropicus]
MSKKQGNGVAFAVSLTAHAVIVGLLAWGATVASNKPIVPVGNSIEAVVIDPALVSQQVKQLREQQAAAEKAEQDRLRRLEQQAEAVEQERKAEEERLRQLQADKLKAEQEAREAEQERLKIEEQQRIAADERRQAEEEARIAAEKAAEAKAEAERQEAARLKAEEQRKIEELAKRQAEEAAKQAEQERKAQEEQKRQAEAAAAKAEAEAAKAAEEAAKAEAERKAEEERRRKAEAARKESERKAREAEQRRREQEAALDDLFQGLEAETSQRSDARGRHVQDEISRYGNMFKQMIERELLTDSSFSGKECRLGLRLSSNGLVFSIEERGGDRAVCRAATTAVNKVSTFPMPEDEAIARELRDINLVIQPD